MEQFGEKYMRETMFPWCKLFKFCLMLKTSASACICKVKLIISSLSAYFVSRFVMTSCVFFGPTFAKIRLVTTNDKILVAYLE